MVYLDITVKKNFLILSLSTVLFVYTYVRSSDEMATSSFTFPCCVRGFHYYKRIRVPQIDDVLDCEWEHGNAYDRFAIKATDAQDTIVGHLPLEISRVVKHLIDCGVVVCG